MDDTRRAAVLASGLAVVSGGVAVSEGRSITCGAVEERSWSSLIHQRFSAQARLHPDRIALWWGAHQLTYGELEARSNRLAHRLRELGVGPEVRVGILTESAPSRVIAIVAVLKAGGAFVAFDPDYPPERLAFLLADARVAVLLADARVGDGLPRSDAKLLCLEVETAQSRGGVAEPPQVELTPDNLAYVVYTSGSTGQPKGVAVPHRGLLNLALWHNGRYRVTPADRGGLLASPAFDASLFELWPFLLAGGGLAIPAAEIRASIAAILRWWDERAITIAFLPTPLAEILLESEIPTGLDLRVRVLTIGGDRLHKPPRPGLPFELSNCYGPAEASIVSTEGPVPPAAEVRDAVEEVSIGVPIDNSQILLLDDELSPVAPGECGELYVAGVGLARGYLGRPELTAERFLPHPFGGLDGEGGERMYRSGDLARLRPEGHLDFLGRNDHQVKIQGRRVELGEIETVLLRQQGVREAAVLAPRDGSGDRRLVGYVVAGESERRAEALRDALGRLLPTYMVPSDFVWLAALPLTPNGKVDRRALALLEPVVEEAEVRRAPRTGLESHLSTLWAELLGRSEVGIGDDFFRLGGHSLLATRMLARLPRELGVELGLEDLFAAPTIEALARRIESARPGRGGVPGPTLAPIPRGEDLPASFAQQRLWFEDRLRPGSSLYNLPVAYRLRGVPREAALRAALNSILRRHEALRTHFAAGPQGPWQRIDAPSDCPFVWADLSALPSEIQAGEAERLLAEQARSPFDLTRGPLFRVLRIGVAVDSILLLAMHHIVADAWSIGLLVHELEVLYRAALEGGVSPLQHLPLQYADFAAWQRRWARGPEMERQLDYWRQLLAGAPPLLELPADRPRPASQSFLGASEPLTLGAELTARLKARSRQASVPLFLTLQAGFLAFLCRTTGRSDLSTGTPFAGRARAEADGLIGFFVNMLVLRTEAEAELPFASLLERVRSTALGAYAHADLPFDRLVEALAPDRSPSFAPLFQVVFAFHAVPLEAPRLPGLAVEALPLPSGTAKYDLTLVLTECAGDLVGELEYSRDLFDGATVRRLAGHLRALLTGAADEPRTQLLDLPLLSPAERSELLRWNETARERDWRRTVQELFSAAARRAPASLAVVQGERWLTYGELDAQSNRLAHHLRTLGVGPETLVALCADPSPERVVGIVAILKAGGAFVPLDPAYPSERLTYLLADAGAPVLLADAETLARLADSAVTVVRLDAGLAGLGDDEGQPPGCAVAPDNLAYLVYTSGSTGRPKGVAIPHRGLLNLVLSSLEAQPIGPGDRGTLIAGPAFDAAVWELWPLLVAGATVLIPDGETRISAARLLRWWAAERVTLSFLPTPLAEAVLAEEVPVGLELRLRALLVGGDRLHRPPRPETPFRLVNHYGPSEYSVVTTAATIHPAGPGFPVAPPIGRALPNTRLFVLDSRLRPVPRGVTGELYIAGAGLARGYHGRAALTAERFVPCPWGEGERMYRTGDLVRWRGEGELDFVGRNDDQIKLRGYRIELGEIEATLLALPQVRDAAVLAPSDGRGGRRLVAYVVPAGPIADEAGVRRELAGKLPEFMAPTLFVWLPALPATANGKVDRRALEGLDLGETVDRDFVPPAGPLECRVAEIWAEVLGVERVGAGESFWALGGHSLLAVQVLARIDLAFGVDLPLQAFFHAPTVAGLALSLDLLLRARQSAPEAAPVRTGTAAPADPEARSPLAQSGAEREAPASFSQQRLWFLDRLLPGTSVYNMPMAYRLHGSLRPAALAAALREIERRQGSFRTRFVEGSDGPVQRIAAPRGMPLPQVDLTALPAELRGPEEERIGALEALRPFDLEKGPLVRCLLVRQGGQEWVLLLAMHHIVSDGWSMGVLLHELASLYEAAERGAPSSLADLPIQYSDYAAWQRERLKGRRLDRLVAYWREHLEGAPPFLELPLDRPHPPLPTYRGGSEPISLSAQAATGLRGLTGAFGASLFMVTLAGFVAHLRRLTGQLDVVVGTPWAARNRVELEGLIGFFVNTLPLRIRAGGDATFAQLIEAVKEAAIGAYANGDLPFERLVEELAPERTVGRSPLFQVSFVLESESLVPLPRLGEVSLEPRPLSIEAAKFDLTFGLTAQGEAMVGEFGYCRDLFDASTIRRMARQAEILLTAGAADPSLRVSELPLLAAAERAAILIEWNATASPYPRDESLARLFARQVRVRPGAEAVLDGGSGLTYGDLDARSGSLARRLRAEGVGAESIVALCCDRSPEMIVAMLAILRAGGAYLPLDPAHPAERLRYLLEDSGATVVLTQSRWADLLAWGPVRRLALEEGVAEGGEREPVEWEEGDGDRLAYVIYTSGSTGRPKGVAIPQRGVARLVMNTDYLDFGPGLRLAQVANAAFDAATLEIWGPLLNGGTVIILPPEVALSPAAMEEAIVTRGIRSMFLTTALFNQLAREAPGLFAPLRDLMVGGEALDPNTIRSVLADRPPARLLNVYGPTENTTYSTWYRIASLPPEATAVPIGGPLANSLAYVLDDLLQPAPIGVPGALYVAGDGLARGYLGRPELTAERFVPAPFGAAGTRLYLTGDRARLLRSGEIEFLGRLDHQVKVRGFRIELGEIEVALGACPGVAEAVVLVRDEETVGKRLIAYVVPPFPEEELRARLLERLPEYMVPSAFVGLERLPVTPNGKIDRRSLAALEVRSDGGDELEAPRTPFESLVAEIWAEVLGLERLGIHQTFWHLGGHSLLATKVLGRIKRELGADLPLRSLFTAPTVAEFTLLVGEALLEDGGEGMVDDSRAERRESKVLP